MHKPSSIISGYDDKQQILQSDRIMVRVMIPTRMAGSVIGKGGQQVKQMRADYGTQIIIPESSGEERLIKCHVLVPQSDDFTGFQNDATEQLKAHEDGLRRCCLVIKRLAEFLQEAEVRFAGGDLEDLRTTLGVQGPDVDVRILLYEGLAHFLKQNMEGSSVDGSPEKTRMQLCAEGSMVKELIIFDELAPRSTDYVMKIVGKPEQISNCVYSILDLTFPIIKKLCINQIAERQYDPKYADIVRANFYGGYTENNNQTADLRELGKAALIHENGPMVLALQEENLKTMAKPDQGFQNMRDAVVFRKGPPPAPPMFEPEPELPVTEVLHDEHVCSVCIPSGKAYLLIGIDGQRLQEIQKDAKIRIVLDAPIGQERVIHIGPGTESAIFDAHYLLRRCLEDEKFAKLYDQAVENVKLETSELNDLQHQNLQNMQSLQNSMEEVDMEDFKPKYPKMENFDDMIMAMNTE